jgi:uncharacterized lipoprotein YmbA
MRFFILIIASLFFLGCAEKNLEYKALDLEPQHKSNAKMSLGIEKPTMPAYLMSKKFTYIDKDGSIKNVPNKRWIEPFDETLQASLVAYLCESYPQAKIASYPWGFYKEPAKRLTLSIESLSLVDGQIILKARYYTSNKKSKIIYFEKHLALTSSYEKALFAVLGMLYSDIAKYLNR